jgi:hypothetical protein
MRRIAGLLSIAAVATLAAPAAAAPPGNGLEVEGGFSCAGGDTTIIHSQGSSAYIGDQHYAVASFAFTPTGGTTDTKQFGQKAGLAGALTCSKEVPEGTFTVVLVPVPPGS